MRVAVLDLLTIVPYYTGYLCRALARAGIEVRLASVTYHLDPVWFSQIGVPIDPGPLDLTRWYRPSWPGLRRPLKLAEYLINLTVFAAWLAVSRPPVLHVQFIPLIRYGLPLETWVLRLARALGIRVVYTVHDVLPHDGGAASLIRHRQVYQLADALIAHDENAKRRLQQDFSVAPGKIHVIPHGPLFAEAPGDTNAERQRLGLDADACLVVYQGILRPYKGVPFLLEAWQRVQKLGLGAKLRVVGFGEAGLMEEIRRKAAEFELDRSVILDLRFVTVEEVRACLGSADVLVYPYSEITMSGALMTGVNYGKAVIATALPAFESLLRDGENALLVRYGDVEGLAAAIERLIRDRGLRQKLGAELGRAPFREVGWEEICERTRECYEAVLPRGGDAR
jgi:glycosyltransferase involved in cell wall biosynthesis